MKNVKQVLLGLILLTFVVSFTYGEAQQEAYPAKAIYCIVPWSAGGGTDNTIRGFLKYAESHVGVDFNVSNITGGGGAVGWTELKAAKPDGYTIGALTYDVLTHSAKDNPPFIIDDFVSLIGISQYPLVLVVKADAPWDDLNSYLDYVKMNNGESTMGIGAISGSQHQLLSTLESKLNLKIKAVPFSGGAEIIASVLGNNVEAGLITSPEAKNRPDIKVLAQFSKVRHADLPEVPTAIELGVDIVYGSFRGLGAPADTPAEIIDYLREKFTETWNDEQFLSWAEKTGSSASYMSGKDLDEMLDSMLPNVKNALEAINQ